MTIYPIHRQPVRLRRGIALFLLPLWLLATALSQTPSPRPQWLSPGTETEVTWLGSKTPTRVVIPENFIAERAWPVLVYFHGTGGRASTNLMRHFTRHRDYIIIGMSYAVPGAGSLAADAVQQQIHHIARVRELLGQHVQLEDRTFVGGFSKGGWMADLLATRGFPTLAGALILGAGKLPSDVARALQQEVNRPTSLKPAIYIGVGQLDTNAVYSRRAHEHYRSLGCEVTMDEFLGKRHEPPMNPDSEKLYQWLALHAAAKPSQALRDAADQWWTNAYQHSGTITDPMLRLLYLENLTNSPWASLSPSKIEIANKAIGKAQRHRSLRAEMAARTAYQGVLRQEMDFKRSEDLVDITESFQNLSRSHPNTHHAKRALLDQQRLYQNFKTLRSYEAERLSFPQIEMDTSELIQEFLEISRLLNRKQ